MNPEDVTSLLRSHSSCRDYTGQPLPDGLLTSLIEAGQAASTDATGQMYSVVRVRDPALRIQVAALSGDQRHIIEASEFLVVCADVHRMQTLLASRDQALGIRTLMVLLFGVTDAALFSQNVVVAAEAHGLGACFIGGVQNNAAKLAGLLHLPAGVLPLYGLTIGPRATPGNRKPRIPSSQVLHTDRYQPIAGSQIEAAFDSMAPATRSGDWVHSLRKYFAAGGVMQSREADFERLLVQQGFGHLRAPGTDAPMDDQNP